MAEKKKAERKAPRLVKQWIEFDVGDFDLTLEEFDDGRFVLRVDGGIPVLLSPAQISPLVRQFDALAKTRNWPASSEPVPAPAPRVSDPASE